MNDSAFTSLSYACLGQCALCPSSWLCFPGLGWINNVPSAMTVWQCSGRGTRAASPAGFTPCEREVGIQCVDLEAVRRPPLIWLHVGGGCALLLLLPFPDGVLAPLLPPFCSQGRKGECLEACLLAKQTLQLAGSSGVLSDPW